MVEFLMLPVCACAGAAGAHSDLREEGRCPARESDLEGRRTHHWGWYDRQHPARDSQGPGRGDQHRILPGATVWVLLGVTRFVWLSAQSVPRCDWRAALSVTRRMRTDKKGLRAALLPPRLQVPELFQWIQKAGNVPIDNMRRTFNMGVGMIMVVDPADVDAALKEVPDAFPLGKVVKEVGVHYK
eukprot:1155397-Pelagomonas_calceolata.AAC.2